MEYKNEIRFIIANKCNSNCIFCHNEGLGKKELEQKIVPDDYRFIVKVAQRCLGIHKFVLTGGEPLIDRRILEIAKSIKNPYNKVNVITNGFVLHKKAKIADVVDEIHISLGALNEKDFDRRTRTKGQLKIVKQGLNEILKKKAKVKLNVVMINYENEDIKHLKRMVDYAKKKNIELYLIEIYPDTSRYHFPFSKIADLLKSLGYVRKEEVGVKVLYQKKRSPDVHIVFIPCAFVNSPLIDDPEYYCKKNQSIYVLPNLTSKPCFEKKKTISILKAVKDRNEELLIKKIKILRSHIGKDCPLL